MKVTRTIVYDGEEEWVRKTLEKSLLKKRGMKFRLPPFGTITLIREETEDGSIKGSRKNIESEDGGE